MPSLILRYSACWLAVACSGLATAQLEDVSNVYLVSADAVGSYLGCGVSCADFNGDGWDDLTFSETSGLVRLYLGGPAGPEPMEHLPGEGEGRGVLWVDVENDGDLDLFVGHFETGLNLYIQDENGVLAEEGQSRGLPNWEGWKPRGLSGRDFDRDGDVDLYVASYHIDGQALHYENALLINDGAGHFAVAEDSVGVGNGIATSFQGSWLDFDDDGWDDLWVVNDRSIFPNALYRNLGNGTFEDVAPELGLDVTVNPMSATVFDPDQDGDWDLFATDVPNLPHLLHMRTDSGFVEVGAAAGVAGLQDYGWSGCVIDIDGDRQEDLMVATNQFPQESPTDNRIYLGLDTGLGFAENNAIWPNEQLPLYNLARFDLDGDRSPDVVGHGSSPSAQLLRTTNDGNPSRLAIQLVGTVSNSHAIGARLTVWSGGKRQMQQVDAGTDYQVQHSYTRFFGMADVEVVDSIVVRWPTGISEVWQGLDADASWVLIEGTADAALTLLARDCPWDAQGYLLPFSSDEVDMVWNGEPVTTDTVWATVSGPQTLTASWYGGQFQWESTVLSVVDSEPGALIDLDLAPCPGDSATVFWTALDSAQVLLDGVAMSPLQDFDLVGDGQHSLSVEYSQSCLLDTLFSVALPDSAVWSWMVTHPSCWGEIGSVDAVISGGTPPWSTDFGCDDPDALSAGDYPVQLIDSAGCLFSDVVSVLQPDSLWVESSLEYAGVSDTVQVVLSVLGGTPPYSVNWSGGLGEGTLLAPGFLGWLVEDNQGCLVFGTVDVPSNPLQSFETTAPVLGCLREEGGIRMVGGDFAGLEVELLDLTGRLLFQGEVDDSGRIPFSVEGVVLVQVRDFLGRSSVWVR